MIKNKVELDSSPLYKLKERSKAQPLQLHNSPPESPLIAIEDDCSTTNFNNLPPFFSPSIPCDSDRSEINAGEVSGLKGSESEDEQDKLLAIRFQDLFNSAAIALASTPPNYDSSSSSLLPLNEPRQSILSKENLKLHLFQLNKISKSREFNKDSIMISQQDEEEGKVEKEGIEELEKEVENDESDLERSLLLTEIIERTRERSGKPWWL